MTTTVGALTYTNKDATMAAFDRIEAFYGIGNSVRPECAKMRRIKDGEKTVERVCGNTTEYIVEPCAQTTKSTTPPKRIWDCQEKGTSLILNLVGRSSGARFLPDDDGVGPCETIPGKSLRGALYIPARICLRCGAVEDGFNDGRVGRPMRRPSKSLTVPEQEAYMKIYSAAWTKATEKFQEAEKAAQAKKDKKRYAEKA